MPGELKDHDRRVMRVIARPRAEIGYRHWQSFD